MKTAQDVKMARQAVCGPQRLTTTLHCHQWTAMALAIDGCLTV